MKVLVACEFSGVVREAFRSFGHDAWSCDLLPCEQYGKFWDKHIRGDVVERLNDGWDLMIAHPPCTYLTNAGVRHLHDHVTSRLGNRTAVYGDARRREMKLAAAFFNDLFRCQIPRICVENPIPHRYARDIIGPYTQLIQPWMFGHGETKATCLWLKNLPPLQPTHLEGDLFCEEAPRERHPRVHLEPPGPDRWKNRSRTFPGIARAMAEQWGSL